MTFRLFCPEEKIIRLHPVPLRSVGSKTLGDTKSADYCTVLKKALLEAMDIFGEDSVTAIVMALKGKYSIKLGSPPCSSIEEIEATFVEITGTGVDIIASRMRSFMW